jgi:hypothetical protein
MFAGLALPGVVAIMHGRQVSTHAGEKPITLGWIAGTALLNASGALMYASKVSSATLECDCLLLIDDTVSGEVLRRLLDLRSQSPGLPSAHCRVVSGVLARSDEHD